MAHPDDMKIGVPKEIKVHEYRVGLVPGSVRELVHSGHEVLVETGAGLGIGCPDDEYRAAGAQILPTAAAVFAAADMVVKVKEPQLPECAMLRPGQVLFTYLHLAADKPQAEALMKSGAHAVAYETVVGRDGSLPLLTPMSEVAGRMSAQVAASLLQKNAGGAGILLGGVPGTPPARVLVIGGGVSGAAAAEIALGMRASVTILDKSLPRLRDLDARFGGHVRTIASSTDALEREVAAADVVIGAVLIPGAAAPKLVTDKMVASMRPGSVLIDIAIDQGGCFATSRPTTHSEPTYVVHGVTHYCVTNMPGAVPRTSAFALNAATLPYVKSLADRGLQAALAADAGLAEGLNVSAGKITSKAVAEALGL
jgi:alanine dehydrogenase